MKLIFIIYFIELSLSEIIISMSDQYAITFQVDSIYSAEFLKSSLCLALNSTDLAKVKVWKAHVCEGLPQRATQIQRGQKISGPCHGFEFFLASCSLPEISQDIV